MTLYYGGLLTFQGRSDLNRLATPPVGITRFHRSAKPTQINEVDLLFASHFTEVVYNRSLSMSIFYFFHELWKEEQSEGLV